MNTVELPADAGSVLAGHSGFLCGWNVTETAGDVATIRLWSSQTAPDGETTGLLAEISLAANETVNVQPPARPIDGEQYANGIYVELVAGAMPTGYLRCSGPM